MAQRAVLWSGVVLAVALFGASAPWSRVLPACSDVPAAQREGMRLAGRCEGRAPIVNVVPGDRGAARIARRPVPELRGRLFNAHDERLGRFVVAIDYRPSAQRRDWVIDQVPRPPASLPEGGDLRVVLSDGALVRVPDVRGSFARALTLLYRAGLGWSSGDEATGRVVGQLPAPGAAVRPGTRVALRIGPGPVALAPESTKPDVAPAPPPSSAPPSTTPAPPPAGTAPAPTAPRTPASPPPVRAAPTMTMPDLQGVIFDAARERLAGLNVQRVHRAGTETGGTVIGQSPAAGTAVAPGATVRLVLSDGSLVRVPRVRSFMIDEARQRLAAGELRPVVTPVPGDAPSGTVVGQQPAEGQIAARGSTIRLSVSSGPAAPARVTVPNLVGSTLERARAQLGRLKVERSERAAREPVGTILEQTPAAGTAVESGSTVSIVVSSGGRPEVIDLVSVVGQNVDAATSALSEFRLERESVASTEPAGRVLSQDPRPGASAPPGSTVRLRISDGSRVVAPSLGTMTLAQARAAAEAVGLVLAPGDASGDAEARVTGQEPAPGTEVARGSALRLTVEERALPFEVPAAVRDEWTRAAGFVLQQSPRSLAIAAVVALALLALLLVARRRARSPYAAVEPVLAPTRSPAAERPAPVASLPKSATPAPLPAATPPAPLPAAAGPAVMTRRTTTPPPVATPLAVAAPPSEPATPPAVASPPPEPATPLAVAASPPEPAPVVFRAVARLESDPAKTVAPGAAPRGPEICIAARIDPGEGAVRELPAETAPDALTEETK